MAALSITPLRKVDPQIPAADPNDQSPAAKRARKRLKEKLTAQFAESAESLSQKAAKAYAETDSVDKAMDDFNYEDDMDRLAGVVVEDLNDAYLAAGKRALDSLKVTDDKLFDLFNKDAHAWAESRGAELVGKKLVGGRLVDNSDARWAITDTTRDGLRSMIAKGYEEGWTPVDLASQIHDSYLFSEQRASMIARTETAKASVSGTVGAWERSGVVERKEWQMSNLHEDQGCDCEDNDGEVVDLDDDFPSGDDAPPSHPNCCCVLVAHLVEAEKLLKFDESEARNAHGEWTVEGEVSPEFEAKVSERVQRAIDSQIRTGTREQQIADYSEAVLSKALGIPGTADNSAFDLRDDDRAIEVKTLLTQKNDKVTMKKDALARKLAEQRADELKGWTVVADRRSPSGYADKIPPATYYVREGFGSFHLGTMQKVTLAQLKEIVRL